MSLRTFGARTALVLASVSVLAVGCNEKAPSPEPVVPSTPGEGEGPATPATPTGSQGAETDAACTDFQTKLCAAAGDASAVCSSIKTLAPVLTKSTCAAGVADIAATTKRIEAMPKPCTDLVKRLCKDLGPETQTCAMVTSKTPSFPDERCATMLNDYPKVLAELKQMEAANQPLDAAKQAALVAGKPVSFGKADAKVTVVEFSDFECPYCSGASKVLNKVKKEYGDRARIVFRQFPLPFHKKAHLAHQAALAAGAEGKFWEYHDMLFANQKALDRSDLDGYAKKLGLDMAKFGAALDNGTYKAEVDSDIALGRASGVNGTPSLFVNGKRVQNPGDFGSIAKMIDGALGK